MTLERRLRVKTLFMVLLMVVCANVANLLLARASAKKRELGIRSALGASRARLIRQVVTESLILTLSGGALGTAFSFWSISLFYVVAQRELYPKHWKRTLLMLPMLMAVGVGLTIINTRAVLEAIFGVQTAFARTAKYAIGDRPVNLEVKKYRRRSGWLPYAEILCGTYFAAMVVFAIQTYNFLSIPFLMLNGDYRPLATRKGNYAAVAAMNASRTRKVGPALSLNVEDPIFKGKLNGHTHMGMLGSTAPVEFDFFLDWAGKNIDNPLLAKGCAVRTNKK